MDIKEILSQFPSDLRDGLASGNQLTLVTTGGIIEGSILTDEDSNPKINENGIFLSDADILKAGSRELHANILYIRSEAILALTII